MRERVVSAAIFVPIVAVVFLAGQPWITLGVAALCVPAATECFRLLRRVGLPVDPGIGVIAAPLAALGMGAPNPPLPGLGALFAAAVFILAAVAAFRKTNVREGFLDWSGSTFGALYVSLLAFIPGIVMLALPLPANAPLHGVIDGGRAWLLVLVLTVWAFDSAAYIAGRFHGRGRFLNHISPKKTWSGVIGGTVAAGVACAALTWAVGANPVGGLLLGVLIAVSAQAGDVAESLLKRAADSKDSGALIPGHGGILDRVDSLLFAAPVVYMALAYGTWHGAAAIP